MTTIESRTYYTSGDLKISGRLLEDHESSPRDADCYDESDVAAWNRGDWQYVTVVVQAEWFGAVIAFDTLSAVEHGTLSEVSADALDLPYPAGDMVDQVLADADRFLRNTCGDLPDGTPLGQALQAARAWYHSLPSS